MVRSPPLSARFFARDAARVARDLLGKRLWCGARAGVIVETEAYLGPEDLASHARFGRKGRSAMLYERGGLAYVYLCYGVHEMMNVVTGRAGQGGAVLIRALEPGDGLAPDPGVARGPGKLCAALGIDRRFNGVDLVGGAELGIAADRRVAAAAIARGPRVGVDFAGAWAAAPLRFWIAGHPSVSRGPRAAEARCRA